MSKIILKKNGTDYLFGLIPIHYPADRVYLDGDTTKTVQDKCARKSDLTNLDLTGTTNTTGSTIPSGTYFYLNGVLVRAKTNIASGATFTLNTNYDVVTVGDALDDLNRGSVSVTADGTKTWGQLLNSLFALVDTSKVSERSFIKFLYTNGGSGIYYLSGNYIPTTSKELRYTYERVTDTIVAIETCYLRSSNSKIYSAANNNISDVSNNTASGTVYLYY